MKKNPWNFAFVSSFLAIVLFLIVYTLAKLTMPGPEEPLMGLENLVAIVLAAGISILMVFGGIGVSLTRAVVPKKYLQPDEKAEPVVRKKNKLLILGLIVIIIAVWGFIYFITTDFQGPKPPSINDNFSTLPEVDRNYRSGQLP